MPDTQDTVIFYAGACGLSWAIDHDKDIESGGFGVETTTYAAELVDLVRQVFTSRGFSPTPLEDGGFSVTGRKSDILTLAGDAVAAAPRYAEYLETNDPPTTVLRFAAFVGGLAR